MSVNVCVLDHSEEAEAFIYLVHHEMQNVQPGVNWVLICSHLSAIDGSVTSVFAWK